MDRQSWLAPHEGLSVEARDLQGALTSVREQLEAMDGYEQLAGLTLDDDVDRAVLPHDAGEPAEHPMMTLEWLLDATARLE